MRIAMQMWKQAEALLKYPPTKYLNMEGLNPWRRPPRDKVVFIMGATGTGKSRLSIDLATRFAAEIINSDKIQVYKGLDILTNKMSKEQQCGVPHHLLSTVEPNTTVEFTARDFCLMATRAVESILRNGKLPIIVGGSNSYIESLVSDSKLGFKSRYRCCFIWVDVSMPLLHGFVSRRVNQMVEAGLVQEVKELFDPSNTEYGYGIQRAIGVAELDKYFRAEPHLDESSRAMMLQLAVDEIKDNTCKLANRQVEKINRLKNAEGWDLNRVDASEVFRVKSKEAADVAWEKLVSRPVHKIVSRFVESNYGHSGFWSKVVTPRNVPSNHSGMAATSV